MKIIQIAGDYQSIYGLDEEGSLYQLITVEGNTDRRFRWELMIKSEEYDED